MVEDSVKISNDKIELEPLNKEIIHSFTKKLIGGNFEISDKIMNNFKRKKRKEVLQCHMLQKLKDKKFKDPKLKIKGQKKQM